MFRHVLALSLLLCAAALAQKPQIAAKLITIHLQGTTRYAEADVLSMLPLKTGQTVTPNDFKAAADRLLESGAFQTVGYEFRPAGAGYALTFKVEDAEHWLKISSYGNFLWFTRDELDKAIRERVPLYRGELPLDGSMNSGAIEALQQLATSRGINGKVRFLPQATLGGPVTGAKFLIEGVEMKVTRVEVTGAGPEQASFEREAGARLMNINYDQDEANALAQLNLVPIAEADGYIRAKVAAVEAKLVDSDVQHPTVAVTVPVTLGDRYSLADIVVSGNQAFTSDLIRKQIRTKNGAFVNDVQLHSDLDAIKKLYGTRGYLMAQIKAATDTDDAAHTVVYRLDVKEGEQFHMGKLQITGVNPDGTAKLEGMWKLKPGDIYSTEYVREFLQQVNPLIPRSANIKISSAVNAQLKTVDVTLQFVAKQVER